MKHILFLDETGDLGLTDHSPDFPIFLLCGILTTEPDYEIVRQELNKIKEEFWKDIKVVFHSRDIRQCKKEFQLLFELETKKRFYHLLNNAISSLPYSIIGCAIHKNLFIDLLGKQKGNIYEVAFSFVLEEAVLILQKMPSENELSIVIEMRGGKEDKRLADHFKRLCSEGTSKLSATNLQNVFPAIAFRNKKENINGLQLADLVAYPIARYLIDPERANPAFEIVKDKIYVSTNGIQGLTVFP